MIYSLQNEGSHSAIKCVISYGPHRISGDPSPQMVKVACMAEPIAEFAPNYSQSVINTNCNDGFRLLDQTGQNLR